MIEPLRIEFDVECPQAEAFAVWTERISTWWPRRHSVSGDPDVTIMVERGIGGRIVEQTTTGLEIPWGEVTAWDPPQRLAYLWYIGSEPSGATDVSITFHDRGDGSTRVEIEHGGWDRLVDGAGWRERNLGGWDAVLAPYRAACHSIEEAGDVW